MICLQIINQYSSVSEKNYVQCKRNTLDQGYALLPVDKTIA